MKKTKQPRFASGGSRKNRGAESARRAQGGSVRPKASRPRPARPETEDENFDRDEFVVVGKNPVLEALRSELQVEKVLILKDNKDHVLKDLAERAKKQGLVVQSVERQKLETLAEGRPHQGVAALLAPFPYTELETVLDQTKDKENAVLVVLDHITDPHNFGAIIRNAEVCGADAVLFTKRRSAGLSPAAVKASSGAAAYMPLVKTGNLAQLIAALKDNGFWIAGADMDGEAYYKANLKGKIALVLGAEGKGLSPGVEKLCDFKVSIPVYGKVDSMNVASAAAVILAEAARQQH